MKRAAQAQRASAVPRRGAPAPTTAAAIAIAIAGAMACGAMTACDPKVRFDEVFAEGEEIGLRAVDRISDADVKGDVGRDALVAAVARGDDALVHALLGRGAPADARDRDGFAVLHLAARRGDVDAADALLAAGADPNAPGGEAGERPLDEAIRARSLPVVRRLLLRGADPGAPNRWSDTPLHVVASDPLGTVDLFAPIATAPLLAARDQRGLTPIHVAVLAENLTFLRLAKELGADLDARSATGQTPLDLAVARRRDLAADLLLRQGAHAAAVAPVPPLEQAARLDDVDRVRRLLAYGLDPRTTRDGKTALDVAREHGSLAAAAVLDRAGR